MATTLILGAGFGGLGVADELRRLLPRGHRIIVIDQNADFTIGATKTWAMTGEKRPDELRHSLRRLRDRGVEFVQTTIRRIDPASRSVDTYRGSFSGDDLVVALGADLNMAAVPGLEGAHHFYSMEGADRLRGALREFAGGHLVLLIPRGPYKCPAGPYEGALLLADFFKKHPPARPTKVSVITFEGAPMATGGPEVGAAVVEEMRRDGIAFIPLRRTLRVEPAQRRIWFDQQDEAVGYDLLVAVPPHEAPLVVRQSTLAGPNGWIPIDKTCAVAGHPQVYAVGDVTVLPLPGRFKPDVPLAMPKAGVIAESQGRVVARRIAARLGIGQPAVFDGRGYCYIETGDMHAMRGDGAFLEMPHPQMRHTTPDMTQFDEKKAWVADTVRRLLGP